MLYSPGFACKNIKGDVAQLAERTLSMCKVSGSIPDVSRLFFFWGGVGGSTLAESVTNLHRMINHDILKSMNVFIGLHHYKADLAKWLMRLIRIFLLSSPL